MKAKGLPMVALLVLLSVGGTFAADWPWYYGPRRDGTSTEKGLLRTGPKEGPKVLWTAPLGAGFGGPAVSRGKVYLLDRDEKVGDTLRVYDFATGKGSGFTANVDADDAPLACTLAVAARVRREVSPAGTFSV